MMRLFATVVAVAVSTACGQSVPPEQQRDIQAAINEVDGEIADAEAETAKYSGGLIKALIDLRLSTLKQTRAMLDQRANSWTFGIGLRHTVDGGEFVPPSDSAAQLAVIEGEIAALNEQIKLQQAQASRYSGGLIQAMTLSAIATSRQTLAMMQQKRFALKFTLPQYATSPQSTGANEVAQETAKPEQPARTQQDLFDIASIDSRVTESNDSWSRFAWRLGIRNKDSSAHTFDATIEFQDSDGFVVDDDNEYGLTVPPNSERIFTGFDLVGADVAPKVASTNAKVRLSN